MSDIMTIGEVADELRIDKQTIRSAVHNGDLAVLPVTGKFLFFRPYFEAFRSPGRLSDWLNGSGETTTLRNLPKTLYVSDIAYYLGVSEPTVNHLINNGEITRIDLPMKKYLVDKSQLVQFVTRNRPAVLLREAQMVRI